MTALFCRFNRAFRRIAGTFRLPENWEVALVSPNLHDPSHPEFSNGADQAEGRVFYGKLIHHV
jgi:hypothetical protein